MAKKTSRKKTLIVIGIVCVVVLIVFVIIDSIVRYRAQMPGSRNFETFEKMSSSTSNIYQMYFQHDGKEYMAEAAYEFEKMTEEDQRQMADLLRADLKTVIFEMIDQAVK